MVRILSVLTLLALMAACSFPLHHRQPVLVHRDILGSTESQIWISCEPSNASAGMDLVGAVISGIIWSVSSDRGPAANAAGGLSTGLLIGSSIYGAVRSTQCRDVMRRMHLPAPGERDWMVVPLMAVSLVFGAALDGVVWIAESDGIR